MRVSKEYLRWQDDSVLRLFGEHPEGVTIRQISTALSISYTVAHAIITRLEKAGQAEWFRKDDSLGIGAHPRVWRRALVCPEFPSPEALEKFLNEL